MPERCGGDEEDVRPIQTGEARRSVDPLYAAGRVVKRKTRYHEKLGPAEREWRCVSKYVEFAQKTDKLIRSDSESPPADSASPP